MLLLYIYFVMFVCRLRDDWVIVYVKEYCSYLNNKESHWKKNEGPSGYMFFCEKKKEKKRTMNITSFSPQEIDPIDMSLDVITSFIIKKYLAQFVTSVSRVFLNKTLQISPCYRATSCQNRKGGHNTL